MIPEWLRGASVPGDRVLVAAWLRWDGEHSASSELVSSVTAFHADRVERALIELVDLIDGYRKCEDDPKQWAWLSEGIERPGAGMTWDGWSEMERQDLLDHMIAVAEGVAALAGHLVAA